MLIPHNVSYEAVLVPLVCWMVLCIYGCESTTRQSYQNNGKTVSFLLTNRIRRLNGVITLDKAFSWSSLNKKQRMMHKKTVSGDCLTPEECMFYYYNYYNNSKSTELYLLNIYIVFKSSSYHVCRREIALLLMYVKLSIYHCKI